jgi:hypothetical protein
VIAAPHDHRRDQVAGARRIVVERPEDLGRVTLKPDLLGQFAQRGRGRRLAGIDAPARQRPLAAMRTQARDAAGKDERGFARAVRGVGERDRDGGVLQVACGRARRARRPRSGRRRGVGRVVEQEGHAAS